MIYSRDLDIEEIMNHAEAMVKRFKREVGSFNDSNRSLRNARAWAKKGNRDVVILFVDSLYQQLEEAELQTRLRNGSK